MKIRKLLSTAVAGLLLLPALPATALTSYSTLTIQLTCLRQGETSCVDDVFNGRVQPVRLGTRQMLIILSDLLSFDFPNGSRIEITSGGNAYVTAPSNYRPSVETSESLEGAPYRWDVTPYLRASFDRDGELINGRYNKLTGEERSTRYHGIQLWFDNPGGNCHVVGVAASRFYQGRPNREGQSLQLCNTASFVNGYGNLSMIEGEEGGFGGGTFYEGRVFLRGRDSVSLPR